MSDYQSSQCSETEASDFEYEGSSCSQDPYEESFGDARDSYEGSGYSHEEGYSDPHSECAQYTSSAASDSQRDTSSDSRDFDDGSKYSQEGGNPSYQHESAQNPEPQGTSSGEKNYEVTAHGTNEHVTSPKHFEAKPTFSSAVADEIQGNHWCNREYLNPNEGRGYHYSNQDGTICMISSCREVGLMFMLILLK